MKVLMQYWMLTGVICICILMGQFLSLSMGEFQDLKWKTGITRNELFIFVIGIGLLFGGALLPLHIINEIYKFFTKKDLIEL